MEGRGRGDGTITAGAEHIRKRGDKVPGQGKG